MKENLIPIGAAVAASVVVASIIFVAFIYLLIAEPVRSAILSDESLDTLLLSVLMLFALEAGILFFLPPIITTLLYERRSPKSDYKDLFMISFASSTLTLIIILIMLHFISTKGLGSVFETRQTLICCPIAFLFWCILSGFVGPITSWIKEKLLKRSR